MISDYGNIINDSLYEQCHLFWKLIYHEMDPYEWGWESGHHCGWRMASLRFSGHGLGTTLQRMLSAVPAVRWHFHDSCIQNHMSLPPKENTLFQMAPLGASPIGIVPTCRPSWALMIMMHTSQLLNTLRPKQIYHHSLQWRHNECDGVSNHHPHHC